MAVIATKKVQQLCCVSVGYTNLILPVQKGIQLVELLNVAIEAEERYDSGASQLTYYPSDPQPKVQLTILKPGQLQDCPLPPRTTRSEPTLIEED